MNSMTDILKTMTEENAKIMGESALAFLANNVELLSQFLVQTGVGPDEVRTRKNDPEFLGHVLDFLLQNDEMIIAFSEFAGVVPDLVVVARHKLPGATPIM